MRGSRRELTDGDRLLAVLEMAKRGDLSWCNRKPGEPLRLQACGEPTPSGPCTRACGHVGGHETDDATCPTCGHPISG